MIEYENLLKNTKVYKILDNDIKNGFLSHCNMIISEDEVACRNLCLLVARDILCKNDNCGKCKDCLDVENNVHEGLIIPESLNSEGIKDLINRSYAMVDSDSKVVLINNFNDIDLSLQNKFLKLIEEPSGNTVFILGVIKPTNVLETIKSRSNKLTIEAFNEDDLKNALKDKYDSYNLYKAILFCEGSLTKALMILSDDKIIGCYESMKIILLNMKKSTNVVDYMSQLDVSKTKGYLDALEIIIKQVIERKTGLSKNNEEDIDSLAQEYALTTLVNIEELVINSKKMLEQNVGTEGVLFKLLMNILEVKYKCQI